MCMTNTHENSFILNFIALKDLSFMHSAKTKRERASVTLHKYMMIHKIQRQKMVKNFLAQEQMTMNRLWPDVQRKSLTITEVLEKLFNKMQWWNLSNFKTEHSKFRDESIQVSWLRYHRTEFANANPVSYSYEWNTLPDLNWWPTTKF